MDNNKSIGIKKSLHKVVRSDLAIVLVCIVMCMVVSLLTPTFLTKGNLINILYQSVSVGVAAIGMFFVVATGGIDLSVGGQVVLSGTVGCLLMVQYDFSIGAAIAVMFGVGLLCGTLNGLSIVIFGMPPFVATLAFQNITRGLSLFINQARTIFGVPEEYGVFGLSKIGIIPISVLIMLVLYAVAFIVLNNTTFGRKIYAVGSNKKASWLAGIKVKTTIFLAYVISGFSCAVVAILLTSKLLSAPGTMGVGMETDAIAAVVIGGASLNGGEGNILCTLIGVLIIVIIGNAMNLLSVSPYLQDVIKGITILLAIILDMGRKGNIMKRTFD